MLKKALKWISVLFVTASLFVLAGVYLLWQDMQAALVKPLPLTKVTLFDVPSGTNVRQLSNTLMANGWIQEALFFEIEVRRQKLAQQLKAGTYELAPGDTPISIIEKISRGDTANFSVRFIEGMSYPQVRQVLSQASNLKRTLAGVDETALLAMFPTEHESLEGMFFPSTYFYSTQSSDLDILKRAYETMQSVLDEQWQKRQPGLPYESPYEALIMASIIEKETGQAAERKQIAGVFVRRLKKGMKLQTDPTVIYGLGEAFDGNLRRKDLRADTPYNTYTRYGLPPTPIAMPGEASIEAALNPADGKALYFVAKGNGWHAFSATLKEHNAAVRKYQLKK